ncbi:hypothetical protein K431DRAFT_308852 [Polychaeton citri CBS 116435]|uniref:F-box domain-containing protein n=1 Tax=Polychaeton citri CBS 116435 TaxID=1314669 RepID=A0A9P4UUH6_9PEZI|nr:hypothetical protein K431DRAFT_308852 [Polychaeton citri CBS 116435]
MDGPNSSADATLATIHPFPPLPAELLETVIFFADRKSLKNLRLASKLTNSSATPLLFEHFQMTSRYEDLIRLLQLKDSPRIAKHVTSFTWYCVSLRYAIDLETYRAIVSQDLSYEFWERCWLDEYYCDTKLPNPDVDVLRLCRTKWNSLSIPCRNISARDIESGFVKYRQQHHASRKWLDGSDTVKILIKESIARFPNLQRLRTMNVDSLPLLELIAGPFSWLNITSELFLYPERYLFYKDFEKRNKQNLVRGPSFSDSLQQANFFLLDALTFRASFSDSKPVKVISFQDFPSDVSMDAISKNLASVCDRLEVLKHVRKLALGVSASERMNQSVEVFCLALQIRQLDLFWSEAERRHSRHLELEPNLSAMKALGDILARCNDQSICFPYLQTLSLSLNVDLKQLKSFLAKHASTLVSLNMYDLSISAAVEDLLLYIHDELSLERLSLRAVRGVLFSSANSPEDLGLRQIPATWQYFTIGTNVDNETVAQVKSFLLRKHGDLPDLTSVRHRITLAEDETTWLAK